MKHLMQVHPDTASKVNVTAMDLSSLQENAFLFSACLPQENSFPVSWYI